MRSLHVALVVKPSPSTRERELRNMGWWSYAVPEFTWDHFAFAENQVVDTRRFHDYDLVFHEDGGNWVTYAYPHRLPVVYLSVDSTLSDAHYHVRLNQAKQADLVLVDHDQLSRFPHAHRFAYCVNDHVFRPLEKTLDIAYHCSSGSRNGMPGGVERTEIRGMLHGICQVHGWSYRSGALGLLEYTASMGAARVVPNWPRTILNRPHRVFDALACGSCLLTGPIPAVSGDGLVTGMHYVEFETKDDLPDTLGWLLESGLWREIADRGHRLVMERHTWAVRARELHEMLSKELGL